MTLMTELNIEAVEQEENFIFIGPMLRGTFKDIKNSKTFQFEGRLQTVNEGESRFDCVLKVTGRSGANEPYNTFTFRLDGKKILGIDSFGSLFEFNAD